MMLRVEPEKPVNSRTRKNNPATQTLDNSAKKKKKLKRKNPLVTVNFWI